MCSVLKTIPLLHLCIQVLQISIVVSIFLVCVCFHSPPVVLYTMFQYVSVCSFILITIILLLQSLWIYTIQVHFLFSIFCSLLSLQCVCVYGMLCMSLVMNEHRCRGSFSYSYWVYVKHVYFLKYHIISNEGYTVPCMWLIGSTCLVLSPFLLAKFQIVNVLEKITILKILWLEERKFKKVTFCCFKFMQTYVIIAQMYFIFSRLLCINLGFMK